MGELIPFITIVVIVVVVNTIKKSAEAKAKPYRPRPTQTVNRAPDESLGTPDFKSAETDFRANSFSSEKDFVSGFTGAVPDPNVTYEEGIDPCHDDMDHVSEEQTSPEPGMSRENASELVRAFVMSEVLSRKRRR